MNTFSNAVSVSMACLFCTTVGWADSKPAPVPTPAPVPPPVFASVSCLPAPKPGRVKCRATIEVPLASKRTLVWAELRILSTSKDLEALRGRLSMLDAESRDGSRIAWTFSLAAKTRGNHSATVEIKATLEGIAAAPGATEVGPIAVSREWVVPIIVESGS